MYKLRTCQFIELTQDEMNNVRGGGLLRNLLPGSLVITDLMDISAIVKSEVVMPLSFQFSLEKQTTCYILTTH